MKKKGYLNSKAIERHDEVETTERLNSLWDYACVEDKVLLQAILYWMEKYDSVGWYGNRSIIEEESSQA